MDKETAKRIEFVTTHINELMNELVKLYKNDEHKAYAMLCWKSLPGWFCDEVHKALDTKPYKPHYSTEEAIKLTEELRNANAVQA